MTYQAILIASVFLLLAFGIERFGRVSGIPSVIVLIAIGLAGKPVLTSLGLTLGGIDHVVPILGTIGLILIVLEGALDIELRREKLRSAAGAMLMAAGGFIFCTTVFAFAASYLMSMTLLQGAILAVPFAVISSAVAIPGSSFLPPHGREFVVYESSISDILGVMVFFSLLNSNGTLQDVFMGLIGGGMLSLALAAVCALGLVLILMRIDGHIRFIPLLAGLFGLYAAGELMHLSPLIMVLLFGLALNNSTMITRFRVFRNWMDDSYETTLKEFKVLTLELTFAVRGFFFILLGYWTDLADLFYVEAWLITAFVLFVVYGSRHIILRLSGAKLAGALTWLAPRGLITILLFLNAKETLDLPHYLNGVVMLVVLISAALIAVAQRRHGLSPTLASAQAQNQGAR